MSSNRGYLLVMLAQAALGITCVAVGSGALQGLGWLTLAAIPGVVATRTWGRRIVGAILVIAAVLGVLNAGSLGLAAVASGCALIGVIVIAVGPRWAVMGSRYERRREERSAWQALDAGEDPTVRGD